MTDSRPAMEQYNELIGILGSHLRIEESLKVQDNDKPNGNNVAGPSVVNMVEHNNSSRLNIINNSIASAFMSTSKLNDSILWHARMGHVHFRRMQDMSKDGLITTFDMDTQKCQRGIECIFVGYAEHSKAFRFYVIKNERVSINSIIESKDAIFDENRFFSVPRPSIRIHNGTEDIGGLVVPEEVTKKVVQQPKLRKSKRNRTRKSFGPEFQLYLIEGTRDENEATNHEMDFIMSNNTWVLANLPQGYKPLGCKWIFKRKLKIDGTIKKFKAKLVIQGFRQKSEIDYFDTYAPVARISTIRLVIALASIHNLVIHQMDVKIAFLNGELDEEVYMNQPQGFNMPGNENKQNQGDVNNALGCKKKAIVITSDPLALVAEKTKVSKQKEKVVVSSDSKGSGADDFSELKKITALLAKAFNRRKFYSKPTNNNLRTSSTSQSANKK
nr:zinc finger, CCHC-type [Tanacetum cinerariifolium]